MSYYAACWMAPPRLLQAMDETAFEITELAWADQRGWGDEARYRELAAQLRTLAADLDHHGHPR